MNLRLENGQLGDCSFIFVLTMWHNADRFVTPIPVEPYDYPLSLLFRRAK